MDVPKESIAVAYGAPEHGAEVVSRGPIGTRQGNSDQLLRQLQSQGPQLVFVDAAGPCGSWLSRSLMTKGSVCWVSAPSLMPNKPGDRVKTARQWARQWARLMRSGDLPPVSGPAADDAASRNLRRARAETLRDLQAARLRLKAFVLRHDLRSTGRAHGRPAPRRWLRERVCPTPAPPMVLQAYVQTVTAPPARLQRLEPDLRDQVTTGRCQPGGEALQA